MYEKYKLTLSPKRN